MTGNICEKCHKCEVMINLYSLSYTRAKNIIQGFPVPDSNGWHCSICGKSVDSSYTACCLHDIGPDDISGEFSTLKDEYVPDRIDNIQFKIDDITFRAKTVVIRRISNTDNQIYGIISKCNPNIEDLVFYEFHASQIEIEQ